MITDVSTLDVKRIARRTNGLSKSAYDTKTFEQLRVDSEQVNKLNEFRLYFDSLEPFRRRFRRTCKFNRGDQWSDLTIDDAGNIVTEDMYIRSQGKLPLKQNIIRPMVKALAGVFRGDNGKSIVVSRKPDSGNVEKMLSNALQYALNINETREIDPRTFDLFMLSGLPIQKVGYDFISELGRFDIMVDYIEPSYIFFNTDIKDVRLNDLRVIGQLHDITLDELYVHFAKTDADKRYLKQMYSGVTEEAIVSSFGLSDKRSSSISFFIASEPHKCRVIEVWEKKAVNVIEYWDPAAGEEGIWESTLNELIKINEDRVRKFTMDGMPAEQIETKLIVFTSAVAWKWFYKYLTPMGQILRQGETPYDHGSHPFIMYPYPLINGEVWGPVEDVIDQQKYANRLFTLWDFMLGTSAKNTLIVDKSTLDGKSPEDLGAEYRTVGSVIALKFKEGGSNANVVPFELGGKMTNMGIPEMIGMQIKWLQDIFGVQPAMQGQAPSAGTPSARYAQEAMNSTNNSRDILDAFSSFRKRRDFKILKTIIQYYKTERYMAISGKNNSDNFYDPKLVQGLGSEFDLIIGQSTDSPTYKSWMDDMLLDMVKEKLIGLEQALPHVNAPWAQPLLEDLKQSQEQIQNGGNPQEAINGLAQNFNQKSGVDPAQVQQLAQMIQK